MHELWWKLLEHQELDSPAAGIENNKRHAWEVVIAGDLELTASHSRFDVGVEVT
jgi:hypothetical protein